MIQKTSISIPKELLLDSKQYARKNGMTFSGMIRIGLEKQLLDGAKNE